MQTGWIRTEVAVPEAASEVVADFLVTLSGRGIALAEEEAGTVRLKAWFPAGTGRYPEEDLAHFLSDLAGSGILDHPPEITTAAEGGDWVEVFRSQHGPVSISPRLFLRPSWCPPGPPGEIVIDPGLAFGTGSHPTTRLSLLLLDRVAAAQPPERMLDLGCGTGILAIAGARLGIPEVLAVDIDPVAVAVAEENIHANHVGGATGPVHCRVGTVESVPGTFDLLTANLSTVDLLTLAPRLPSLLRPGGTLIVSGIVYGEEDAVTTSFAAAGLDPLEVLCDAGWTALSFACRAAPSGPREGLVVG